MKRVIVLAMFAIFFKSTSAQTVNAASINVKNKLTIKNKTITDIQSDTNFVSDSKIPTSLAVKKIIDGRVATGGNGSISYIILKDTFYILATGQSNSAGSSDGNNIGVDTTYDPRVQGWSVITNSWVTLVVGREPMWAVAPNYSPSAQFFLAKKIAKEKNCIVRVVNFAVGGQSITNWVNGLLPGPYLTTIINITNAAGIKKYNLIVWDQGEADAAYNVNPFYAERWSNLKQLFRKNFADHATPIVAVGMGRQYFGAVGLNGDNSIDEILQSFDYNDDVFDGYATTDSATLVYASGPGGSIHFDSKGLEYLGTKSIYNTYLSLPQSYQSTKIANSGRLGVGTNKPRYKLHVSDSNLVQAVIEGRNSISGISPNGGALAIGIRPDYRGIIQYDGNNMYFDNTDLSPSSTINFRLKTSTNAPLIGMSINGYGNAGFGTTNANYRITCYDVTKEQMHIYGYAPGSGSSAINGAIRIGQDASLGAVIKQDNGILIFDNQNYFNTARIDMRLNTSTTPIVPLSIITTGIKIITQEFSDNAAALSAGLVVGAVYRTGDDLKIVH
jgi:Carbohydrate esterase, sialic acid-specific acetylesterase